MSSLTDKIQQGINKFAIKVNGNEPGDLGNHNLECSRLSAFVELLQQLKPGYDVEKYIPELFRKFLEIMSAQSIILFVLDKNQNKLVPGVMVGEAVDSVGSYSYQEENLLGKTLKSGIPTLINEVDKNENALILQELGKKLNFSSVMLVPYGMGIKGEEEIEKGVVCIFREEAMEPFNKRTLEMFSAFSGIIGIIREYSEIKEKLKAQSKELDRRDFDLYTVYQVTKTLSSILDVEELTMLIADMLTEVITVDHTLVFLMDEEETNLKVMAYKYLDPGKSCPVVQFKATDKLASWLTSQASEGKIIKSFENERFKKAFPDAGKKLQEQGIELIIPMIHKFKLVGFLALGKKYIGEDFKQRDFAFLSTIAPLAANAISNAHLYEMAILDGLTRVFLGRYFQQRCKEELKRAKRYDKVLSLIMWDIDHFKSVNDNYGHLTGDAVLKEMTTIFKKSYRQGIDLIGRYGGEEFVMLLPDTSLEGAVIMAERLRKKVAKYKFCKGKIHLTISGGIATFPEDGATYNQLIEKADINLYRAKRAGRNRVCYYEPELFCKYEESE